MSTRSVTHLHTKIHDLIDSIRDDFHISYAEIVGVLEMVKADILDESRLADDEDDDGTFLDEV